MEDTEEEETVAIADDLSSYWDWDRDRDRDDDSFFGKLHHDYANDKEEPAEPLLGLPCLDENGFPPFQDEQDGVVSYNNNNNSSVDENSNRRRSVDVGGGDGEESFASNFYSSGTDWSCLLQIEEEEEEKKSIINDDRSAKKKMKKNTTRLKQANLFQLWGGFQQKMMMNPRPHPRPRDEYECQYDDALTVSRSPESNYVAASLPLNKRKKKSIQTRLLVPSTVVSVCMAGESSGSVTGSGVAHQHQHQHQLPRVCPFYKKIPGTPFTVDAFRYGHIKDCSAYFLSHFHADHYGGLSKGWSHGPIYCTLITAHLIRMSLSVNPSFIHPLELGTEYVIEGIKVTMLEANHCPGAALIHFHLLNGQCYLHTGDFRASKLMQAYPLLMNQRINVLYLDTTYCNPKYRFPSKEDVLDFVVRVTTNCLKKHPKTLVIVGAYSIGKEHVYLAISKALGVKIYANPSRRRILHSFGWPEISGNLCTHGRDTPLHVLPISSLRFEILERYLKTYMNQYTAVLAFRPTGWTYSETIGSHLDLIKPSSKGIVTIYGVPYSEHSSFVELREFVKFLRPEKIIPTVNVGNAANRDKMQSYFREWLKG